MKHSVLYLVISLILIACWSSCKQEAPAADPDYVQEIDVWHKERVTNLTRPDGWLTLAGLFWLHEGENRFGSDPANDLVFPKDKAPAFMGVITLQKGLTTGRIDSKIKVQTVDSTDFTHGVLYNDVQSRPTILQHGSLSWYVVQRGVKYGVRLRDRDHPNRLHFKGIERYPVDPEWRVTAHLQPYQPAKEISVVNVVGNVTPMRCPGALTFTFRGKTFSLDALAESGEQALFIIFNDETSGSETYGSGRFLYADKPNDKGETVLDFNKAYNPPCAFTPYATCPLPPAQNHLDIKVQAGEKKYAGGH